MYDHLSTIIDNSPNNEEMQLKIEKYLTDFQAEIYSNKDESFVSGVNVKVLGGKVANEMALVSSDMDTYIEVALGITERRKILVTSVLKVVGADKLKSMSLYYLLLILTYADTNQDENYNLSTLSVKVGKQIFNCYLIKMKGDSIGRFSVWKADFLSKNPGIKTYLTANVLIWNAFSLLKNINVHS